MQRFGRPAGRISQSFIVKRQPSVVIKNDVCTYKSNYSVITSCNAPEDIKKLQDALKAVGVENSAVAACESKDDQLACLNNYCF